MTRAEVIGDMAAALERPMTMEMYDQIVAWREALAQPEALTGWQPIVTFTRSERTPILRHHKSWGTMVVMWLNNMWYSPGYTTMWPEDAFMPVWMPSPEPPAVTP